MSNRTHTDKDIIGRVERVQLVDHSEQRIPAKVDTGADISSIWVSNVNETNDVLQFVLFSKGSRYYTGEVITLQHKDYRLTQIENSFGVKEFRYVVKLRTRLNGRIIKVSYSLANRSMKIYPILLGRRLLKNKFIVDVTKGKPLLSKEANSLEKMRIELDSKKV